MTSHHDLSVIPQSRYATAAEAFVALGGRAGFVLSQAELQKSLRELSVKARQATPAVILDLHGLMSDVESDFEGGLTFSQARLRFPWQCLA